MKSPFTQGQKRGPIQSIATGRQEKYAELSWTVETKKRTGAVKEREENPEILIKEKKRKGKPRASRVWLLL